MNLEAMLARYAEGERDFSGESHLGACLGRACLSDANLNSADLDGCGSKLGDLEGSAIGGRQAARG